MLPRGLVRRRPTDEHKAIVERIDPIPMEHSVSVPKRDRASGCKLEMGDAFNLALPLEHGRAHAHGEPRLEEIELTPEADALESAHTVHEPIELEPEPTLGIAPRVRGRAAELKNTDSKVRCGKKWGATYGRNGCGGAKHKYLAHESPPGGVAERAERFERLGVARAQLGERARALRTRERLPQRLRLRGVQPRSAKGGAGRE